MSNTERKKIPDAPIPAPSGGNLLSSVGPPLELPNFITAAPLPQNVQPTPIPAAQLPPTGATLVPTPGSEEFSPAIPLSKGQPVMSIRSPDGSQDTTQSPVSLPDSTPENPDVDKLGDIMPGSGLITWMKGAVSTGGILQRVAEKAKSSVDSMITTLDPQMKEYLNSGGDMYVVVASDKDVKISPVREAFQNVFGKATVVGMPAQSDVTAVQPVSYACAYAAAKQRIAHVRATNGEVNNNVPIIAVEGFLHEAMGDRWYEISLAILSQPSLGIELQVQTQGTPVPAAAVAALREATPSDYPHKETGFSVTIGKVMGDNLQVPHTQWQEAATGVSRRESLVLAARSLAGSYKKMLAVSAAES